MTPQRLTLDIPATPSSAPHQLVCWQWGNHSAPETIVCVHGLTRNAHDFDFLAEALAADYRVICPNMAGRGDSDNLSDPLAYNYATYVSDMQYMLNALALPRVHWIGTSMGGIIGMMLAATGRLQSLTLNDVGCVIASEGLKRIGNYVGVGSAMSYAQAEAALRKNCAGFGIEHEYQWRHFIDHSVQFLNDGRVRLAYDPNIMATFPKGGNIEDVNLWPCWQAMTTIPLLLIRGERSDILRKDTALQMQALHPNFTLLEIPGAGHAPALMDDGQIGFIQEWLM